jgi:hypothetical protein
MDSRNKQHFRDGVPTFPYGEGRGGRKVPMFGELAYVALCCLTGVWAILALRPYME